MNDDAPRKMTLEEFARRGAAEQDFAHELSALRIEALRDLARNGNRSERRRAVRELVKIGLER